MRQIHYAWFICVAGTLLSFCCGGLVITGFGAYLPYLVSQGGLTNTQVSQFIFIRTLSGVAAMVHADRLIRRFGVRQVVTGAMAVSTVAFLLFGIGNSFPVYCGAGVLGGIAFGTGSMIPVTILVSEWFHRHNGLVLGICMAATGISAFVGTPVITVLVERLSLKTAFYSEAGFMLVCTALVWRMVRNHPGDLGLAPLGTRPGTRETTQPFYASRTAGRMRLLVMLTGWFFLGAAANNLHTSLSVLYQSVGFTGSQIAPVISLMGLSLAAGKCTCGLLSDRIGIRRTCTILFAFLLLGTGICCMAGSIGYPLACAGAALCGFGCSVATVATAPYAMEVAREKDYGKTVSGFQTTMSAGGLVFSLLPGILADRTGDYTLSYGIMFLFVLVSFFTLQGTGGKRRLSPAPPAPPS